MCLATGGSRQDTSMKNDRRRRVERGFTLIELLVVVVIIGLIAAIAVPGLRTAIDSTKQTRTVTDLTAMRDAIERYELKYQRLPEANNIVALVELLNIEGNVRADHSPFDSWRNELQVSISAASYTICSGGKDGGDCLNGTPGVTENVNDAIILANGAMVRKPPN